MFRKLRVPAGVAAGLALAPFENKNMFGDDASDGVKYMNTLLLGGVGGLAAAPKSMISGPAAALGAWLGKMPLMLVGDRIDKFTRAQQPIAETNLETARLSQATAELIRNQASRLSASDMALLGLSAAGIGGLGYKVWRDSQPAKRPPARVKVTLPTKQVGDTETSIDMALDPVTLSKKLYDQLNRDTRRRLAAETEERTLRKKKKPEIKEEKAASARDESLRNLVRLANQL